MKELIVIIGAAILGAYIFNMMVADRPDSLLGTASSVMKAALAIQDGGGGR